MKKIWGLTITEWVVCIVVCALLGVFAFPRVRLEYDLRKFSNLQFLVRTVKTEVERDLNKTKNYPSSLEGITLPSGCKLAENNMSLDCGNYYVDYLDGQQRNVVGWYNLHAAPTVISGDYVGYALWLGDDAKFPGRYECRAGERSHRMQALCSSISSSENGYAGGKRCPHCKRYWMD